jgi:hypothetical protein
MDEDGNVDERFKTRGLGVSTSTWAATNPKLNGMHGTGSDPLRNRDVSQGV